MRFLVIFTILVNLIGFISSGHLTTNIVHLQSQTPLNNNGFWTKKVIWKPRWVKTWQEKRVYVAVWKKVWGPSEIRDWVPLPKPPPGWIPHPH